jgi:hypothetical protein
MEYSKPSAKELFLSESDLDPVEYTFFAGTVAAYGKPEGKRLVGNGGFE